LETYALSPGVQGCLSDKFTGNTISQRRLVPVLREFWPDVRSSVSGGCGPGLTEVHSHTPGDIGHEPSTFAPEDTRRPRARKRASFGFTRCATSRDFSPKKRGRRLQ